MTAKYALTWDLDSLFPNPSTEAFHDIWEAFRRDLTQLATDSESLPDVAPQHAPAWSAFVDRLADLSMRTRDLVEFVLCHASADAENKEYRRIEGALAALDPLRQQVLTNVELKFRGVSGADIDAFTSADQQLSRIRFFLDECVHNAAFRLPKEQELLAADLAVDGLSAWSRLYDRLSGGLRVEVMERGELVRKSPGQVTLDSPERNIRQNNFYAADKAWRSIADTCADALNHIAGARLTKYRRLGVQDHLDLPLRLNRVSRQTLGTMWTTIIAHKPCLLRYFDAKARLLGLERLAWYDQVAPLPTRGGGAPRTLSYDDACDTVIKTFGEFSQELGEFAQHAVDNRWIEVENRPGKRQGGFCCGMPSKQQSRIFMTFTNSADSMSTLAHELGHAYHSYVLRDQPYLLSDYPMNLAETASTFAEAILGEKRLADAADDDERRAILDHSLSDAVAFLMNIHTRFIFENALHVERQEGELPTERFFELMEAAQREAYLGVLADDGWYPGFWISKLHFYIADWPFYNFPYTFGYLLSQGLYALAVEGSDDFPRRYRELLIATGCRTTEQAVQEAIGYDLSKPDFWNRSLDLIERRVDDFCTLCDGASA